MSFLVNHSRRPTYQGVTNSLPNELNSQQICESVSQIANIVY